MKRHEVGYVLVQHHHRNNDLEGSRPDGLNVPAGKHALFHPRGEVFQLLAVVIHHVEDLSLAVLRPRLRTQLKGFVVAEGEWRCDASHKRHTARAETSSCA